MELLFYGKADLRIPTYDTIFMYTSGLNVHLYTS